MILSAYVKCYDDEAKWMICLIKYDDLLKKYNDIWNKVSKILKKNVILNPSTIKCFKKQKSYGGDETTGFHAIKIPKAGSDHICWSVILIESVLKKDENYYPLCF